MQEVKRLMSESDFFDVRDGVNIDPVYVYYVLKNEEKKMENPLDILKEQVANELHIPVEKMGVCTVIGEHSNENTGKTAVKVGLSDVPDFNSQRYAIL